MTDEAKPSTYDPTAPINEEFERRLAALEQILDEMPAPPPDAPRQGILAAFLAAHPAKH